MPRFLYCFGFETPLQARNNAQFGWDDEDSHRVWIIAPTEAAALEWGRHISERFVASLFGDPSISWAAGNFAHWIETDAQATRSPDDAETAPVVEYVYPDFTSWA